MGIVYKPGQGRYARIATGAFLAFFAGYGCRSLQQVLGSTSLPSIAVKVIPVALFLVAVAVISLGLNYPRLADFLIETEIEMGRVVWPTRKEVLASSLVVIVTLLVMAALLYGADWLLLAVLRVVGLY